MKNFLLEWEKVDRKLYNIVQSCSTGNNLQGDLKTWSSLMEVVKELFQVFLSCCCKKGFAFSILWFLIFLSPLGKKLIQKYTHLRSWSSNVALYCKGISINAAKANSASFWAKGTFLTMISVKLTNCVPQNDEMVISLFLESNKRNETSKTQIYSGLLSIWKLLLLDTTSFSLLWRKRRLQQ